MSSTFGDTLSSFGAVRQMSNANPGDISRGVITTVTQEAAAAQYEGGRVGRMRIKMVFAIRGSAAILNRYEGGAGGVRWRPARGLDMTRVAKEMLVARVVCAWDWKIIFSWQDRQDHIPVAVFSTLSPHSWCGAQETHYEWRIGIDGPVPFPRHYGVKT